MRPPICAICRKRFSPRTEGESISFPLTEEEQKQKKFMKINRRIGHPPGLEWFCNKHLTVAKKYKHLHRKEALTAIKAEL